MATSKSILDALSNLNEHITETHAMARTFTDLNGHDAGVPEWPYVVEAHVRRIERAAEALETLVRQKALPVLDDMERVQRK